MKNIKQVLANNLLAYRDSLGISRYELSQKSGVSATSISNIESCVAAASIVTIDKLAKALNVSAAELLDDKTSSHTYRREY